jgi:hypothetical protein
MHIAGGVDHPVDQVKRQDAFEAAHPEWRIWCDERYRWHAERDGERVDALDLRGLLDELDSRCDEEQLRHRYGDTYQIEQTGPLTWLAARRDGGGAVHANTPADLEAKIVADYDLRPVPRDGGVQ